MDCGLRAGARSGPTDKDGPGLREGREGRRKVLEVLAPPGSLGHLDGIDLNRALAGITGVDGDGGGAPGEPKMVNQIPSQFVRSGSGKFAHGFHIPLPVSDGERLIFLLVRNAKATRSNAGPTPPGQVSLHFGTNRVCHEVDTGHHTIACQQGVQQIGAALDQPLLELVVLQHLAKEQGAAATVGPTGPTASGVRVEVEHVVVVRVVAPHGGQVDVGFPQTEAVVLIVEHPAELALSAGSPTPAFDVPDVEVLPVDDREMVVDEVVNIQVAILDGPVVARICH